MKLAVYIYDLSTCISVAKWIRPLTSIFFAICPAKLNVLKEFAPYNIFAPSSAISSLLCSPQRRVRVLSRYPSAPDHARAHKCHTLTLPPSIAGIQGLDGIDATENKAEFLIFLSLCLHMKNS